MNDKLLTFEAKCYENDWEFLLKTNYLDTMISRCGMTFAKRNLIINNVKDKKQVCFYAKEKMAQGIIDNYYLVGDYANIALDFYKLSKKDLGTGYCYSIAELVGLYLCETKYQLHFSSDAIMQANTNGFWIESAIALMESNDEYFVTDPTWNNAFDAAKGEAVTELEYFYVGYGFSDQRYLVNANRLRADIYREYNLASDRYPKYGGELFEKRVDSYMRNHNLKRLTSKSSYYIHRNFPKSFCMKKIRMFELALRELCQKA